MAPTADGDASGGASKAAALKEEGNAKFKAGEYAAAIDAYTRSIELDPQQHLCFSNRSAAYLKLGSSEEKALADAKACVELAPTWAKGYSRQAAALQALKRWDEAAACCEKGLQAAPDDSLKKMLVEVRKGRFCHELQGTWHGTVNEVLGGYDQEMEFLDETSVRVEVLGRSILGRFWVDCGPEPHHLNIQVPMQDVANGMPPGPPVPYIARVDSEGLHICCPFMQMERPTSFEGPGYCLMKKGALATSDNAEVEKMSREEKLLKCTQELIQALPSRRLEEVQQTDSEDATRDKLMAQVRFESSMFAVQKRFGEDIMKEVLAATRSGTEVPECLKGVEALVELQDKLKLCGILEEEGPASRTVEAPRAKEAVQAQEAATEKKAPAPREPSAEEDSGAAGPPGGAPPPDGLAEPYVVAGALAICAVAIAGAWLLWRRRRTG